MEEKNNKMTLQELSLKYSFKDLGSIPGDGDLRYQIFSPILKNLYENKIVYYERFMCVAILKDIIITPELFQATAIPYIKIERVDSKFTFYPIKPWKFGTTWSHLRLFNDHFAGYGSWLFWPEKDLVKYVEEKARKGKFEEALKLTLYKDL